MLYDLEAIRASITHIIRRMDELAARTMPKDDALDNPSPYYNMPINSPLIDILIDNLIEIFVLVNN